jgi:hypothetical protein
MTKPLMPGQDFEEPSSPLARIEDKLDLVMECIMLVRDALKIIARQVGYDDCERSPSEMQH